MSGLLGLLVLGVVVALVLSRTEAGRRLLSGRREAGGGRAADEPGRIAPGRSAAAPHEDHQFLLDACGGNEEHLLRRLEAEIRRNPDLSEAQLYRRAIRSWFQEKRGGTHGMPGGEDDDTWL